MSLDQTGNFIRQSVASAVSSGDTTISVTDASAFPDPSNGNYNLVLWDTEAGRPDQDGDVEVVRVTGRDTTNDDLTVSRGQETTSDVSHPDTSALQLAPTAKMFGDIDAQKLGDGEDFDGQGTSSFTGVNDIEVNSINAESAHVDNPFSNFADNGDLHHDKFSLGVDSSQYIGFPMVAENNGPIAVTYVRDDQHTGTNNGYVGMQISTDYSLDFGDEIIPIERPHKINNDSFGAIDGEYHLFSRESDRSSNSYVDLLHARSEGGESWDVQSISSVTQISEAIPMGKPIETSRGILVLIYGNSKIETIESADGGDSWSSNGIIADSSGVSGRDIVEPYGAVVGGAGDNVLIYGRENEGNAVYSLKSADGGGSFNTPSYFQIGDSSDDKILSVIMGDPNTLTVLISDRSRGGLYRRDVDATKAFADPTILGSANETLIDTQDGGSLEFGYPYTTRIGTSGESILAAWYDDEDGDGNPEVYLKTIGTPAESTVAGTTAGNIEYGAVDFGTVAAGSSDMVTVSFSQSFDSIPTVTVSPGSDASGRSGVGTDKVRAFADKKQNGFDFWVVNDSSVDAKLDSCSWWAVGP
jgi:hypothetical protein